MSAEGLIAFAGVAILLIVTPGQDMALVMRNTLSGDRRAGLVTSFGVVSGLAVWATVSSAGITAILQASQALFNALKFAGALYLGYLGFQALRSAVSRTGQPSDGEQGPRRTSITDCVAYRQGLISNLGNPKIAVFFSSLLPQFAGDGTGHFVTLLALGLLFCGLTCLWLGCYAALVDRAGRFMRRSKTRRVVESLTGIVLVGLALRLATSRR